MFRLCLVIFAITVVTLASGQEPHEHGVNVPDWYDSDCCSNRDCRPVPNEDVDEVEPGVWVHLLTGIRFYADHNQVRMSKDGRFHVCISEGPPTVGHCIYIGQSGV